ncbi:hypothetical protein [Paraburkholderia sp. NMBU_R16]|nr:hypothetical protein [Paraburkholderia sp. NMBU_R16]
MADGYAAAPADAVRPYRLAARATLKSGNAAVLHVKACAASVNH